MAYYSRGEGKLYLDVGASWSHCFWGRASNIYRSIYVYITKESRISHRIYKLDSSLLLSPTTDFTLAEKHRIENRTMKFPLLTAIFLTLQVCHAAPQQLKKCDALNRSTQCPHSEPYVAPGEGVNIPTSIFFSSYLSS